MTARKTILIILVCLLPCGFVILLTRSVLRSSLGERFLKGTKPMRKLALLSSAVLLIAALVAGCGGSTQPPPPLAPRSLSLSIRDHPPTPASVLSFEIKLTTATMPPPAASTLAAPLVVHPASVH